MRQGDPRSLPEMVADLYEQMRAVQAPTPGERHAFGLTFAGPASYTTGGFPVQVTDVPVVAAALGRLAVGAWDALDEVITLDTPYVGYITVRVLDASGELAAASDLSDLQWSLTYLV